MPVGSLSFDLSFLVTPGLLSGGDTVEGAADLSDRFATGGGTRNRVKRTRRNKSVKGSEATGVREVILEKIYFTPLSIDAGLIVEDTLHNIDIWNAFTSSKTITQIQEISANGVDLNHKSIPFTLLPLAEIRDILTINKNGAPIQNTTIIYTIGGDTFTLTIAGKRILLLKFLPDMEQGIDVTYSFETKEARNEFFLEQRFSLRETPLRTLRPRFYETGDKAIELLNELDNKQVLIIGFPVYVEPLVFDSPIQGETTVNPVTDVGKCINWQRLTEVAVIMDDTETIEPEIKTVSEVGESSITFSEAIQNNFTDSNTFRAFPLALGVLSLVEGEILTHRFVKCSVQLEEVRNDNG